MLDPAARPMMDFGYWMLDVGFVITVTALVPAS
jgi:hypothetical protein